MQPHVVLKPEMFPQQILLIFIRNGRQMETIIYADDENVAYVTLLVPLSLYTVFRLGSVSYKSVRLQ